MSKPANKSKLLSLQEMLFSDDQELEEGSFGDFMRTLTGRDADYLSVLNAATYTPQDVFHDPEVAPLVKKYKNILANPENYEQGGPLYNATINLTGSKKGKGLTADKVKNAVFGVLKRMQ